MLDKDCPIMSLLTASPWPLSVEDIARVLEVDEVTAVLALRLLRQAGRARPTSDGKWIIIPTSERSVEELPLSGDTTAVTVSKVSHGREPDLLQPVDGHQFVDSTLDVRLKK